MKLFKKTITFIPLILFSLLTTTSCGAATKDRLEMVNGDSWVSGYYSAVLLDYAIRNNKPMTGTDNLKIWIDTIQPSNVEKEDYDDYKKYFVDEPIYYKDETENFLVEGGDKDFIEEMNNFSIKGRIEQKKKHNKLSKTTSTSNAGYSILYNIFGPGSIALDYLARRTKEGIEQCGATPKLLNNGFNAAQMIEQIAQNITDDVRGVCIWAPAGRLVLGAASAIEGINKGRAAENKIWYTLSDKVPDEEIEPGVTVRDILTKAVDEFPYFAGAVGPANDVYGTQIADYAIEKGWKSCLVTTSQEGDASDQPRYDAFKKEFESKGGKIMLTINNDSPDVSLENVRNGLNILDKEPDFVYGVGSTYGTTAIIALEDFADWKTKIITSGLEPDILAMF